MVEEGGEGLLETAGECLLGFVEVGPRPNTGVSRGKFGSFGNDAEFQLPLVDSGSPDVPSFVESATVLGEVLVGSVVGCVLAPKGA